MSAIMCSMVLFSCSTKQVNETTDQHQTSEIVSNAASEDNPPINPEIPDTNNQITTDTKKAERSSVDIPAPNHPPQRDKIPPPHPKDNPVLSRDDSKEDKTSTPTPSKIPTIKEKNDEPIQVAEVMPLYGGCNGNNTNSNNQCSQMAVIKYLASHVKYPEIARENEVQGTVIIQFVVEKTGKVNQVQVLRDIGNGCGQEAMRVIKSMPNWTPGTQEGKPVDVIMRQPVKFRLQ